LAQRERRARLRAQKSSSEALGVPLGRRNPDAPGAGRDQAGRGPADALGADRSTPVLPSAAALARLHHAEQEYERARVRDWRRSVVAPSVILQPLAEAVRRARMECRRLGVREDWLGPS
jgi:hypothetical protein